MSRSADHMHRVSERLSEVMDDIGVNEILVMTRRSAHMLMENIETLTYNYNTSKIYHFGSQSEGSTTSGLKSDCDSLLNVNVHFTIQHMNEQKSGADNLKMIEHQTISPGYCHLQCIRDDLPANVNDIDNKLMQHCVTDSDGRLLLKNTLITKWAFKSITDTLSYRKFQINGPALTRPGKHGLPSVDSVTSFYCASSPHQITSWLQKQREHKCPTEDVLEECRNVGCFVVPVGGKKSYEPDLEWRISTSLQERYLMFNLNITQLRCLVLMKMILKTYIKPHVEDVLSSYMCKNVLWYCIANSSHDWHTGNLLSYLHLCLFMLKECVKQRNCPHLMIPENNLLAGRMTDKQRGVILDIINNLMINNAQFLYEIQIDDLGRRLKTKLSMTTYCPDFLYGMGLQMNLRSRFVFQNAEILSEYLNIVLEQTKDEGLEMILPYLQLTTSKLETDKRVGDFYQYTASELMIPLVSSILGSVLASSNIETYTAVSDQAFTYLEAGKESDALSGRLKLVSVLYCTGDMERAESELGIIEIQYNISELQTVCACLSFIRKVSDHKLGCIYACCICNVAIKSHFAFCTRFLQCEINCVQHELRYEILRSYIEEDIQMRTPGDSQWMDNIVVDSIPYLYFLHYKINGHLQRRTEQQKALYNLELSIDIEPGLGHIETAYNLLGQCKEQENMQTEAFQCYICSLKHRVRNNAARFLLCIQLFKLWKQHNTHYEHILPGCQQLTNLMTD